MAEETQSADFQPSERQIAFRWFAREVYDEASRMQPLYAQLAGWLKAQHLEEFDTIRERDHVAAQLADAPVRMSEFREWSATTGFNSWWFDEFEEVAPPCSLDFEMLRGAVIRQQLQGVHRGDPAAIAGALKSLENHDRQTRETGDVIFEVTAYYKQDAGNWDAEAPTPTETTPPAKPDRGRSM